MKRQSPSLPISDFSMSAKLFLSSEMGALVDRLIENIEKEPVDPLELRTLLVPNGQIKEWLLLEMAKRKGVAMGLKVIQPEQLFPPSISSLEMFGSIYAALSESLHPEIASYLQGKEKRILELTCELGRLFFKYGQFDASVFQGAGWQNELLRTLFIDGPWRLPIQQPPVVSEPVIVFGVDFLAPIYWEALFQAPALSIYLFSPCAHFWEDLCSDRERKSLDRYWKKRGAPASQREKLDAYLRDAPKNLANWGKLGRETLKILDRFSMETEEIYPFDEPATLLGRIQTDLLLFQETESPKPDGSIQLILTGSSRLKEIEAVRHEILRLEIPYADIAVLAPDIEPYVPLIEYVFSPDMPYRISGFDSAPQSSFGQGIVRLLRLPAGRWEAEELLALFETPAFYRKQGWDGETLETVRAWIGAAHIEWGLDEAHRNAILKETLGEKAYEDENSWEKGLDRLLDALISFKPLQIDPDRLEALLSTFLALKKLPLCGSKPLSDWAESLKKAAETFLLSDPEGEVENGFDNLLAEMRAFPSQRPFPAHVIEHLLARPCRGKINPSHLHAIRFGSIDEELAIPARALFLIGMDEESFPRPQPATSLDLMQGKGPDRKDQDRYLFLKAIFSAKEILRITYGHLSPDEGKPVGPSLLVQELLHSTGPVSTLYDPPPPLEWKKTISWPQYVDSPLPKETKSVKVSDLRQCARHPWKFYLKQAYGISLKDDLEKTFALQKGELTRAALGKDLDQTLASRPLPPGIFGKAMRLEVGEKL